MRFRWCWLVGLLWVPVVSSWTYAQGAAKTARYQKAMKKALAAYQKEDWSAALKGFRLAIKRKKGRPSFEKAEARIYLGLTLRRIGKQGMAIKLFELALYAAPCLLPPASEPKESKAFFESIRKRVFRRGGAVSGSPCSRGKSPTQSSGGGGGGGFSPWPWVALGAGALLLTGGVVLMANGLGLQERQASWEANTAGQGYNEGDLNSASQPLRDSAGWQFPTGIALLITGVLAAGASIPMFLLIKPPAPKASASRMSLPHSPARRARVRLLSLH